MDRRKFIINTGIGLTGLALNQAKSQSLFPSRKTPPAVPLNRINPIDNGKALINPQMGWTMHFYDNSIHHYGSDLEPSDTLEDYPGLSTVYLRLPWSFIESEEGKFNWEILDTPAQRWIEKGKNVALRISASEPMMRWATPEWVANAGAKGLNWGKGRKFTCWGESWDIKEELWEPIYDDPIFLEKVENFVKKMASRYDGNPNISFIDIGHMGLWGEGHTVLTTQIDYDINVLKRHIDLYCKYFKKTQLCISDDFAGHDKRGYRFPITDYAFSKGVTIRDDSILVQLPPRHWYHSEMAQLFWPKMPVILETNHYGAGKLDGTWNNELLMQSVEDYHASYMSIHWWPKPFLEENRHVIEKINLRLGYRLQLQTIHWPQKIRLGEPFIVTWYWANAGVAPCYPGGFPCVTLKDEKGGLISVLTDEGFNVTELQVSAPSSAPIKKITSVFTIAPSCNDTVNLFFRGVKAGIYDLYVSVGKKDGTPVFELPYNDHDGHKRYKMGSIEILARII